MGWKSNSKVHFSKQMLLFHLLLPFNLWYVKKFTLFSECYRYCIPYIFSVFYFWMLQFTDRISSWNQQNILKEKRYSRNVTLPSQIFSRNYSDYYHFGLSMAIIINYYFFQNLSLRYICAIKYHVITDFRL